MFLSVMCQLYLGVWIVSCRVVYVPNSEVWKATKEWHGHAFGMLSKSHWQESRARVHTYSVKLSKTEPYNTTCCYNNVEYHSSFFTVRKDNSSRGHGTTALSHRMALDHPLKPSLTPAGVQADRHAPQHYRFFCLHTTGPVNVSRMLLPSLTCIAYRLYINTTPCNSGNVTREY